ncbi:MAG: hypothetical protein JXB10_18470 [Pirellulales bacterium]|nr:hypothetical protein [Pirellulales bacterium]
MGRPARVKSIDALQAMSAALTCFRDDAAGALDDLEMEIRRALQWIGEDCRQYWKQEIRRGEDRVIESQRQLEHAEMFRRAEGQHSPCVEEQKALARAKQRLETARRKAEAVKHWIVAIDRAVNEYRAIRSHLVNWLDADFPRAVAVLNRMITALETYIRLEAPTDEHDLIARALAASPVQTDDPEKAKEPQTPPPESLTPHPPTPNT